MKSSPHTKRSDADTTQQDRALDPARRTKDSELREWLDEWRWWLGGAIILSAVWAVQVLRTGMRFYWPVGPLGVWAAVLVAVAMWPRSGKG